MNIRFFYDAVKYRLRNKEKVIKLVNKVIRSEKRIPGDLNFILTSDSILIEINREFLNHNYFTDVIAFGECNEKVITGEIYISIDTVKINANNYKVSFKNELLRVIIHGTLHLCGYEDSDEKGKAEMKRLEDKWLKEFVKTER